MPARAAAPRKCKKRNNKLRTVREGESDRPLLWPVGYGWLERRSRFNDRLHKLAERQVQAPAGYCQRDLVRDI
jgi:hypothetical protein